MLLILTKKFKVKGNLQQAFYMHGYFCRAKKGTTEIRTRDLLFTRQAL